MAKQGAALQTFNNELVKALDDLFGRRKRLEKEIEAEERDKAALDAQLADLKARLAKVEASLDKKRRTKAEYDKTIGESETAFNKILESSQVLLNVVKKESDALQTSENQKL